jgi:hypothetical protein
MPGNITPDLSGKSGNVTFSLVIAIPFQMTEFTYRPRRPRGKDPSVRPLEESTAEVKPRFGMLSISVFAENLAVSTRECQFLEKLRFRLLSHW